MQLNKELNALQQLTRDFQMEEERHQELHRRFIQLCDEAAEITHDMNYVSEAESRFHYRGKTPWCSSFNSSIDRGSPISPDCSGNH